MYREGPYKVWYKEYDENGNEIGEGVSVKEYETFGHADNFGRKHFGDSKKFKYEVAYRNPFKEYTAIEPCGICGRDIVMKEHHFGTRVRDNHVLITKRKDRTKSREFTCCEDCFNKLLDFVGEKKESER